MKKVLLIAIVSLIIYSCKKESSTTNPDNSTIASAITGRWNYGKDSVNAYKNGQFFSKQVLLYTSEYMQFNADGTGRNDATTFTYTISGKTLTLNFAAYTVTGVQYPAEQATPTILELSSYKLYLFYDYLATGNNSIYATLSK